VVTKEDILAYAKSQYDTAPEYLWARSPDTGILRHRRGQKWYAIFMSIEGTKVGLNSNESVEIMNVKCEPDMIFALCEQKGFAPAYHMNKKHWITIILNGSVRDEEIYNLLDVSYEMTRR
jgi:predicted DNA-binding protein (MmcQ/YjbR family)